MKITSRENTQYKEIKHLATDAKARRKAGKTVLDGIHLCQAYLEHIGAPLLCVTGETAQNSKEAVEIIQECEKRKAVCLQLSSSLFKNISQVENGIELLFLIDIPNTKIADTKEKTIVCLDQVQDPGNLGSILRSAASAGIKEIYCATGTAQVWSPRVLRAAMGAHFLLNVHENADLKEFLRTSSRMILATSSHAKQTIFQTDLRKPLIWLFGNEGQGVSASLMEQATHLVSIPHKGKMESLNVASSAAICLFEQVRQNL